jgi:DNA-binding NarL/FixJ family response regulator
LNIGVLLVDDEPLIRTGLRAILDAEPGLSVLGEAGDGAEVAPLVRRLRPDVIVMDIRMPGVDGIEATRRVLAGVDAPPRILILTTFEHDDHVFDALRAGAAGFLLKRAEPGELVRAIRLLADGDSLLFPAAIRRLAARQPPRAPLGDAGLTRRELEVLRLMSRGLSNAELAEHFVVSLETVKTHVSSVLNKLGARDRTQAVIRAYDSGFVSPSREGGESDA